jgi:pSer/pThr/pTyr-binding forkhead associated (FHA) protein
MELDIGIVCGRCEAFSDLGTSTCASCGGSLALAPSSGVVPEVPSSMSASVSPVTTRTAQSGLTDEAPAAAGVGLPLADLLTAPTPPVPPATATRARTSHPPTASNSQRSKRTGRGSGLFTPPKAFKPKSIEELMDQAKNFVCRSCSTAVPLGHKFCGRCGAAVPSEILQSRTQFFGQLQAPGKAKLILIRGEGIEGVSYQLNAENHVVGRNGQLVFPDDPFVSPTHANFFYRNGKLVVRDEGSLNGVFLRVRGSVDLQFGDHFLAGEQLFRVDATPKLNDQPGPDGTFFYSSPKHQSPFRIVQVLQGGSPGMTVCARGSSLQIGREGGDLNFPSDLYMSASHCRLEDAAGKLTLTDMSSRNGTYVRLLQEYELGHGDYVFIGRKLLRVEITAA